MSRSVVMAVVAGSVAVVLAGCAQSATPGVSDAPSGAKIAVVAAENEYADVVSQIGGDFVSVSAIVSDPTTDPHTFEADPAVAKRISAAQILVQNGVGYDDYMSKLANASPNTARMVVNAQKVLGLPDDTANPHLWYNPATMPAVGQAIEKDLAAIDPAHAGVFQANLARFTASLTSWTDALTAFQKQYGGTPVAVTEPVADYMLQAGGGNSPAMIPSALTGYTAVTAGVSILTPWTLQAAKMNGTDASPQDSTTQDALFTGKKVKVFLYNQQVTDSVTAHYLALAKQGSIPVVGVYETMPAGYTYQTWMQAEVAALQNAVASGASTETLG